MNRTFSLCFVLLGVAWLFVTIFSFTTSPLYHDWGNGPDAPMFLLVGKYWADGLIPYRDLWDMKGPFVYFVDAAGFYFSGAKWGVYLIQCLSLFLTLLTVHRAFALHFSDRRSLLLTLLSLAGLAYIYEGGNLTEEYLLFPLSLSFYYILKWTDSYEAGGVVCHPPLQAVTYGVVLGLSLMSRLTNALGLCGAVGVIALTLLWHREYRNLLSCMAMFVAGFALTTLPFLLYFHHHDALQQMWNATFLFPLEYASTAQMNLAETGIHYFALSYLNSALLLGIGLWMMLWRRTYSVRTSLYLFSAGLPFLWFCMGNGYGHYGMTVYPLFVCAMTELCSMKSRLLPAGVGLLLVVGAMSKVRFVVSTYPWESTEVAECRQLLEEEPSVDLNSFVAYGCDPRLYLSLDVCPAVPVFALQEIGEERIPQWSSFLVGLFREKQPEWILVKRDPEAGTLMIQPLLDGSYKMVRSNPEKQLELYERAAKH